MKAAKVFFLKLFITIETAVIPTGILGTAIHVFKSQLELY